MVAETKQCRCCKRELPRSDFFARASNKDGLYSYCRACNIIKVQAYQRRPEIKARKREYDRERVARLKDDLAAKARERYKVTREQKLENARRWSELNPEKRKAISQSYKHRRRSIERQGMSGRQLADWKREQTKVCHWCGAKCARAYHVDHYVPLSKGGKHEAENLVIACRDCNYRKHAKDPLDFAREVGRLL